MPVIATTTPVLYIQTMVVFSLAMPNALIVGSWYPGCIYIEPVNELRPVVLVIPFKVLPNVVGGFPSSQIMPPIQCEVESLEEQTLANHLPSEDRSQSGEGLLSPLTHSLRQNSHVTYQPDC